MEEVNVYLHTEKINNGEEAGVAVLRVLELASVTTWRKSWCYGGTTHRFIVLPDACEQEYRREPKTGEYLKAKWRAF